MIATPTPILFSPTAPSIRLLTIADVAVLPTSLPTGDVRYELDDGRLVVMPPPGDPHAACQFNLITELNVQGQRRGHGVGRGDVSIVLRRNPDRMVGPDASFFSSGLLPLKVSSEGFLETIPDLVVEIRSKNDTLPEVERKVAEYFAAGVRVVWVPNPATKSVTEYRPGQTKRELTATDVLTVPDVIPGFQVVVAELF